MIIAALAGCGGAPTGAPPITVPPSGSTAIPKSTSPKPSPSSTSEANPTESFTVDQPCARLVRKMSMSERVGQLLMVAVSSSGISASERTIMDRTGAGSVLLLGNSTAGM